MHKAAFNVNTHKTALKVNTHKTALKVYMHKKEFNVNMHSKFRPVTTIHPMLAKVQIILMQFLNVVSMVPETCC